MRSNSSVMLMNMLKGLSVSSVGLPSCSAGMIKNVFVGLFELETCHFYCFFVKGDIRGTWCRLGQLFWSCIMHTWASKPIVSVELG